MRKKIQLKGEYIYRPGRVEHRSSLLHDGDAVRVITQETIKGNDYYIIETIDYHTKRYGIVLASQLKPWV